MYLLSMSETDEIHSMMFCYYVSALRTVDGLIGRGPGSEIMKMSDLRSHNLFID